MHNSIKFIGNVDRILIEDYYMDKEENLSFFTNLFL